MMGVVIDMLQTEFTAETTCNALQDMIVIRGNGKLDCRLW